MIIKLIAVFILLSCLSYSSTIDSLKNILQNSKIDTNKVILLNKISFEYLINYPIEGLKYANLAKQLAVKLNYKNGISEALNNLGNAEYMQGNYNSGIEYHNQALAIQLENNDKTGIANSYNHLGLIYNSISDYNKAIEYFYKSLRIREIENNYIGIAASYTNLGNAYSNVLNYSKAIEFYQKALNISSKNKNTASIASTLGNLGVIYTDLGEYDKALEYLNKSYLENSKLRDLNGMAMNYGNIGNCYIHTNDLDNALKFYKKALELNRQINSKSGIAYNLVSIGVLFISATEDENKDSKIANESKSKNLNNAIINLQNGIELFKEMNALDELSRAYYYLHIAFTYKNDYKEALNAVLLQKEYQDSVFNQNKAIELANLETKRETEIRDQKISILENQKQNERNIRLFFVILSVLILVFTIIIYWRFRVQKLLSKSLEEKNRIIEGKNDELSEMNFKIKEQNIELEFLNQALTERNIEISKTQEELICINSELRQTNQSKDTFLSIISHDLKNPFNYILSASELMIKDFDSITKEQIYSQLLNLNESGQQVYSLLENLLNWANTQSGKILFNPENISVDEIVKNNLSLLSPSAQKKEITIVASLSNIIVYADYNMLNTIFRNLISNAIKFTNKSGIIQIKSEVVNGKAIISVVDNGIGMKEDVLCNLFSNDKNLTSKGTSNEIGTGLGLKMCKEFVEKNSGEFFVESKENIGSNFSFTLQAIANSMDYTAKDVMKMGVKTPKIIFEKEKINIHHFEKLKNEFQIQRDYCSKNMQITMLKDFSENLNQYANENGIKSISNYSLELKNAISEFDFEKIRSTLEKYESQLHDFEIIP